MELPFKDTRDEFEQEFKTALGFVDVDLPYIKIKPDLKVSATNLIKVIGKPTYEALIANYNATDSSTPKRDDELNEAFQYAIATRAYQLFAPANDLAHTPNGRRMRSSDDQKTPFEWMMAKDDDNLQKRTYKAIDSLINYMDESFEFWKTSDQFKLTHKLFVRTLDDFSSAYILDSRLLLIKLVPGLNQAEQREILPRIGAELFESLKAKIIYKASGETTDTSKAITADEALLISLIKEACAFYALSWGFIRLQVNMFPEGILQSVRAEKSTVKGRSVPIVPVIDQISKLFKNDSDNALINIEIQIEKMFPRPIIERNEAETNEDRYGFSQDDPFVTT